MIKVGIIGAGIGREHLRAYLQLADLFVVVMVCDQNLDRAREIILQEGAGSTSIKVVATIDEVLDSGVDLVDICLPPRLHVDIAKRALAANKHVLCEKPVAPSLEAVDQLIAAEQASGKTFTPVFQYRYGLARGQLQRLVDEGLCGKALVATVETHWHRDKDYYASPWRGTREHEFGGAVISHAIHNHDLVCQLLGKVKRVSAFLTTAVNPIEVEDCAAISLQMESGALVNSSITLGAARDQTRIRVVYEHLTADSGDSPYNPMAGSWIFTARKPEFQRRLDQCLKQVSAEKNTYGFVGLLQQLGAKLNGLSHSAPSLDEGRQSLELVTAIYQSAAEYKAVDLP